MILLRVITLPSANNHLPTPYCKGEIVQLVGENPTPTDNRSFDKQFIEVYRPKNKQKEVMSRSYFINVVTKRMP
jgi:hypothetical protein